MTRGLLVFLAGGVGACLRYLVVTWTERTLSATYPWGVLGVNVVGSFAIALVAVLAVAKSATLTPTMRVAITAGLLGGLTTYSSFNQDTLSMLDRRAYAAALGYVVVTLLGCLAAGALGAAIARRF